LFGNDALLAAFHANGMSRMQFDGDERICGARQRQSRARARKLRDERPSVYSGNATDPEVRIEAVREVVTCSPVWRRQKELHRDANRTSAREEEACVRKRFLHCVFQLRTEP
jgi:hypothetical protein